MSFRNIELLLCGASVAGQRYAHVFPSHFLISISSALDTPALFLIMAGAVHRIGSVLQVIYVIFREQKSLLPETQQ